jgi:hypothetical protein
MQLKSVFFDTQLVIFNHFKKVTKKNQILFLQMKMIVRGKEMMTRTAKKPSSKSIKNS